MVVWALTAGIGIYLLAVGITTQRAHEHAPRVPVKTETPAVVGTAALPVVLGADRPAAGKPAAEESALLEFVHPALALLGLTFWICYTMSHYRAFAWVAFGVAVATIAAGLTWEAVRRRMARGRAGPARGDAANFPPHLIMLHGAAAACTFALVVITTVVAR